MMIVSRADFRTRLLMGMAAAAFLCGAAATAWAQDSATSVDIGIDDKTIYLNKSPDPVLVPTPVRPVPYVIPGTVRVEDHDRLLPSHGDAGEKAPFSDKVDDQPAQDFEMGALAEVDPGAFGLVDQTTGGLPRGFWRDIPRAQLVDMVSKLPTATRSPQINALVRRVLISSMDVPAAEWGEDPGAYLRMRAMKLAEGGNLSDLVTFLGSMPDSAKDASLLRLRAEVALLSGDNPTACRLIDEGRGLEGSGYWLRMDGFCSAIKGSEAEVAFTIALLDETGNSDPVFNALVRAIAARAQGRAVENISAMPAPKSFEVLDFALFQAAARPFPVQLVEKSHPLVLTASTMRGEMPLPRRLTLATAAARRGLFNPDDLLGLSLSMRFQDGEYTSAALLADDPADARTDALLLQAGLKAQDSFAKINILELAWQRARSFGDGLVLATGFHHVAKSIAPQMDWLYFAGSGARMSLAAGDFEGAMRWYELAANAAARGDLEGTRILMGLWPYVLIRDEENAIPYSSDVLELWRQSQTVVDENEARRRAAYLFAIVEAFDHDVPQMMWDLLAPNGTERGAADGAQDTHDVRQGALLLEALARFNADGPKGLEPKALGQALAILRRAGFDDAARVLAVEAMIGLGF